MGFSGGGWDGDELDINFTSYVSSDEWLRGYERTRGLTQLRNHKTIFKIRASISSTFIVCYRPLSLPFHCELTSMVSGVPCEEEEPRPMAGQRPCGPLS